MLDLFMLMCSAIMELSKSGNQRLAHADPWKEIDYQVTGIGSTLLAANMP
jgi:hypothetical protein